MPTLRPPQVELPPRIEPTTSRVGQALHRPSLYQVEFHDQLDASANQAGLGALLDDDDDDEWSVPIRARLLDARLQRLIIAAANGWVIERYVV